MLRLFEEFGMVEGEVFCGSSEVARGVVVEGVGMERSQFWVGKVGVGVSKMGE